MCASIRLTDAPSTENTLLQLQGWCHHLEMEVPLYVGAFAWKRGKADQSIINRRNSSFSREKRAAVYEEKVGHIE